MRIPRLVYENIIMDNKYIMHKPFVSTHIFHKDINSTYLLHFKNTSLHSVNNNPALIHIKTLHNPTIVNMKWFHNGIQYRHDSPSLPAEIGFYPDGELMYECFYNEYGQQHSHDNLPSLIRYCYSKNINKMINLKIWHTNNVATKTQEYNE